MLEGTKFAWKEDNYGTVHVTCPYGEDAVGGYGCVGVVVYVYVGRGGGEGLPAA